MHRLKQIFLLCLVALTQLASIVADEPSIDIKAQSGPVLSLNICDRYVASAGKDDLVCAWDLRTGKKIKSFGDEKGSAVSLSRDGKTVITCGERQVKLWDFSSGKLQKTFDHQETLLEARLSPDGKRLVTTTIDSIRLWDLNGHKKLGEIVLEESAKPPLEPAFSPSGKTVAIGCWNGILRLLSSEDLSGQKAFRLTGYPWRIAFSPSGKQIAVGFGEGQVKLYDFQSGEQISELKHHKVNIVGIAFSDESNLVTAGKGEDVCFWDLRTKKTIRIIKPDKSEISSMAFLPKASIVAIGTKDGQILVRRIK